MNDKGQALIEATLTTMVATSVFIATLLTVSNFGFHFWSKYHLHQANLCLANEFKKRDCKKKLLEMLSLWPFQTSTQIRLTKTDNLFKSELVSEKGVSNKSVLPRNLGSHHFRGHYE